MARDLLTGSVSGNDTDHDLLVKAAYALQELAGTGDAGGAVQYTPQTRTAAEQLQARTNIGAQSSAATPAFFAKIASATPVTSDGTDHTYSTAGGYDQTEYLDTTNSFDGTTGIFTAPEAGVYRFEFQVAFNANNATRVIHKLFVNGSQARMIADFYTPGVPLRSFGFGILVLAANDQVQLAYAITGAYVSTQPTADTSMSWWSGYKM